jgi:hypothetical protein
MEKEYSEKCVIKILEDLTLEGVEMELRMAIRFDYSKEEIADLNEAKKRLLNRN